MVVVVMYGRHGDMVVVVTYGGRGVLQACDVAIEDSSERVMDLMVKLLKDFTSSFVVTPQQFDKVFTLPVITQFE